MSKILIIDDNVANREILRLRLELLGHDVIEAVDGEEGVLSAASESPALIFLDVMMPKKDGIQTCKELKANPKTQMPVIMLSALNQADKSFQELGAQDFMSKPWGPEQLKKMLVKWLPL